MMHLVRKLRLAALLLAGALLPCWSWAAGTATLATGNDKVTIYWQDSNTVRVQPQGDDSYTLATNGKLYSVSQQKGQARVIDLSKMMQLMGGMAKKMAKQHPSFDKVSSMRPSGRSETLAGIRGEVYLVTGENNKMQELVLSNNALAEEMTRAYFSIVKTFLGQEGLKHFLSALPSGKQGMLRAGDDWRLLSISDKRPADSLFVLPAPPQDASQEMQGLQTLLQKLEQNPEAPSEMMKSLEQMQQQMQPQMEKMQQAAKEMQQQMQPQIQKMQETMKQMEPQMQKWKEAMQQMQEQMESQQQ